jgi:hypothetical protein
MQTADAATVVSVAPEGCTQGPGRRFPTLAVERLSLDAAPDLVEARRQLAEDGFCVFKDAASAGDLATAESLFWDFVESRQLGIDRNDPRTLRHSCWRRLASSETTFSTGLLSQYGIGQSEFMWHCRQLGGVQKAFATAWGCGEGELITGFDSCAIMRNFFCLESDDAWRHNGVDSGAWLHVDQNHGTTPELSTFQGLLNFLPATAVTGATVLVPGSHLRAGEIFAACERGPADFVMLDGEGDFEAFCGGAVQVRGCLSSCLVGPADECSSVRNANTRVLTYECDV